MYEYIKGSVAELTPTGAVIEAGGVGYYLHISLQTFSEIEHASEARLWVHYLVREDAQLFYGFATRAERELFRLLLSVSGVGGNTARMILSTYSPRELQSIIATENAVLLKSVKGLGLKTAQKIIVELSGKMAAAGLAPDEAPKAAAGSEAYDEALAALFRTFTYDRPRAEVCCEIGRWFFQKERYSQAAYWYALALTCPRDDRRGGFVSPDCYGYLPCIQLCVCYSRLGDRKRAELFNELAASCKPDDPAVLQNRAFFQSAPERPA